MNQLHLRIISLGSWIFVSACHPLVQTRPEAQTSSLRIKFSGVSLILKDYKAEKIAVSLANTPFAGADGSYYDRVLPEDLRTQLERATSLHRLRQKWQFLVDETYNADERVLRLKEELAKLDARFRNTQNVLVDANRDFDFSAKAFNVKSVELGTAQNELSAVVRLLQTEPENLILQNQRNSVAARITVLQDELSALEDSKRELEYKLNQAREAAKVATKELEEGKGRIEPELKLLNSSIRPDTEEFRSATAKLNQAVEICKGLDDVLKAVQYKDVVIDDTSISPQSQEALRLIFPLLSPAAFLDVKRPILVHGGKRILIHSDDFTEAHARAFCATRGEQLASFLIDDQAKEDFIEGSIFKVGACPENPASIYECHLGMSKADTWTKRLNIECDPSG